MASKPNRSSDSVLGEAEAARFPSRHQLLAAVWAGRVLDKDGTRPAAVYASYPRLPIGGRLGLDDLVRGGELLIQTRLAFVADGLVRRTERLERIVACDEDTAVELLLAALLDHEEPLWLRVAAADDQLRAELVPDVARRTVESVIPDANRREAFLLAQARRVDAEAAARLGARGEEHVVATARAELEDQGHPELAAQVERVSLISDELGYDVTAPRFDGKTRRLEVKTTRAVAGVYTVVITRNEATYGKRDRDWSLVICALEPNEEIAVAGWCPAATFADRLPEDPHGDGRWKTAELTVWTGDLTPGLPPSARRAGYAEATPGRHARKR